MTRTSTGSVEVRREGPVAVVTLDRPAKLNALSTHLETELLARLRSTEVATCRAVVVTGGDRAIELANELAEAPALALSTAKHLIDRVAESGRGSALLLEQLAFAALDNHRDGA